MNFREMRSRLIGSYAPFMFFPDDLEIPKIISSKAFTHLIIDDSITVYSHKSMEEQLENELKEEYDVVYETPEIKREYYVSPYTRIEHLNFKFKNGEKILKKALRKPFPEEIEIIKEINKKINLAVGEFWNDISLEMKEWEIKALLECKLLKSGIEGFLYPTIVASGPKTRFPIPSTGESKIEKNKIIYIDSTPQISGYPLNFSRVVFTGEVEEWISALNRINRMYESLFSLIKAGVSCNFIDNKIREIGDFPHYSVVPCCGFYQPYAPGDCILEENMILNVVPSIYLQDGVIRVKRNIIVKKDGCEFLI